MIVRKKTPKKNLILKIIGNEENLMISNLKKEYSLSTILMASVFSIYFIIIILTTSIQLVLDYRNAERSTYREINSLIDVFKEPLSESIWEFNDILLSSTLKGIMKNPLLKGVEVRSVSGRLKKKRGVFKNKLGGYSILENEKEKQLKKSEYSEFMDFEFPLFHRDPNQKDKKVLVGRGVFYSSRYFISKKIRTTFFSILISELIKTITIFIFFLWAFRRFLENPLGKLIGAVEKIDFENLDSRPIEVLEKAKEEES